MLFKHDCWTLLSQWYISTLHCFSLTDAVVFPIDVSEIITRLALAEVASKRVAALTVERTLVLPGYTFINVWRRERGRQPEMIRHLDPRLSLIQTPMPYDLWFIHQLLITRIFIQLFKYITLTNKLKPMKYVKAKHN